MTVAAGAVLVLPSAAWAHGIGGRGDLPVPLRFFLYGAALVLVFSFAALAVLWPRPRLQDGPRNHVLSSGLRPISGLLRVAGVAGLVLVVWTGLAGAQGVATNLAPVAVWVVFWLVLPFMAAWAGNLWGVLNPWRTLGEWLNLERGSSRRLPGRIGIWPATAAFLAFTWLELVYPASFQPRTLAIAALLYTFYLGSWMVQVGVGPGLQAADAFTIYHRLISSIAPFGRDAEGRLVWRGWLRALPVLPAWPGLAAFVVAMIGTVTYDGLSATPWWSDFTAGLAGSASSSIWFETLAFVTTVAAIGAGYLLACRTAARLGGGELTTTGVARSFAHTLVPIGLAYAVAHYFTLVLLEGQMLFSALSDPLGAGWDLFGTADWQVNYVWLAPRLVWYIQVGVIVAGHLLGVVLAHDRALAVFPVVRAVRTQYALLALMVALTGLGLIILAAG